MASSDDQLEDLLKHDAWIRALAGRLLTDRHAAEDVAQDAWIEAIETPPSRPAAARIWFRRVVSNLVFKRRRSLERRRRREERAARPERLPSVAEMRERAALRHSVTMAVFALEEPYRSAVLYRYFENLPPREIAERLDVSVAAIEGRLRRGIQMLRARLDRDFGDRRTWCAALLPLIGRASIETATAAGSVASPTLLTGALLMSTKAIKIGIAILIALGVAYAVWPGESEVKPPDLPDAEPRRTESPATTKKELPLADPAGGAEVKVGKPTAATPTSRDATALLALTPARGSIVGRVADTHGAAIPGARVRALRFDRGAPELPELLSTRTDERGVYVLKPVSARCVVEASADHYDAERRVAGPFTRVDFVLGPPGTLEGQVILAADRTPCAGALVAAYPWHPVAILDYANGGFYYWTLPPTAVTRSDAAGTYRFDRLRPGPYRLRVVTLLNPELHSGPDPIPVEPGLVARRDMVVASGIRLIGRVTDKETGSPIAGAVVFLSSYSGRRAVTDSSGRYEIVGLSPGPSNWSMVCARVAGYPTYARNFRPAADPAGEQVLDIALERGLVIVGRVLGPDGAPVAGARVSTAKWILQPRDFIDLATGGVLCTLTDKEGRFEYRVRNWKPDRRVYAIKEGLGWGESEPFTVAVDTTTTRSGVVVRLKRAGTIAGRVTDESGEAVEGAWVSLFDDRSRRTTAYSREDGGYEIAGVTPGTYSVCVLPPGSPLEFSSPCTGLKHAGVTLSPGGRSEVNLVLRTGPVISGRVVDESGRPLEAVLVRALPRSGSDLLLNFNARPPCTRTAVSDAQGQFCIGGLWEPGHMYLLQAKKPGFDLVRVRNTAAGRTDVLITLPQTKSLRGRVVLGATGEPALEFKLRGFSLDDPQASWRAPIRFGRPGGTHTHPEGRFTVPLRPGRYALDAQTPDGQCSDKHPVEIPVVGEPKPLEIKVWPGASIAGRVQFPDGTVPSYASVKIYDLGAHPAKYLRYARVDTEARFEARSLPAGSYLLWCTASRREGERLEGVKRVEVQARTQQEVTLILGQNSEVEVRVTGPDKKPMEGVKVAIERTDGAAFVLGSSLWRIRDRLFRARRRAGKYATSEEQAQEHRDVMRSLTVTDRDGRLATLSLCPGDYVIKATAAGYAPWKTTTRIQRGGKRDIAITLRRE